MHRHISYGYRGYIYHQHFVFPQFSFIFVLHYSMASETMASRLSYDPMVYPFVTYDEKQSPRSRRAGLNSVSRWRGRYKGEFTKPGNRKCKHHYLNLIFIVRATERCNRKPINRYNINLHPFKRWHSKKESKVLIFRGTKSSIDMKLDL